MAEIGYTLSSEEHGPLDLVDYAQRAEKAGFGFATISDHYHPWVEQQGNSPFVWAVLGGVSQSTESLPVITAVTCPTTRIHPAIIAQAAATAAAMLPGRFSLGLGAGERLNEHILGDPWPDATTRQERLEEAVEVIRLLWQGGMQSHHGRHYTVENARIFTLPNELPPILIATAGEQATALAARIGDGMVGLVPDSKVIDQFEGAGGNGKPRYGQVHVCWAESEDKARKTALDWWPNTAVPGNLPWELPLPAHFEQTAELIGEDEVAEGIVCSPDADAHLEAINEFIEAGYDHVFVHQVGPDQSGFFDFYEREVLPQLSQEKTPAGARD